MKTKCLLVTVAMLVLACQPKKETNADSDTLIDLSTTNLDLSMADAPPACAAPPVHETVKFVPPIIKDDATEEVSKGNASNNTVSKTKKIIKDGSISIKVTDVEASKKRMDAILKVYGAYYENENFANHDIRMSYQLKVRVPTKQFEALLKASEKGNGEVMSKNINARDVTEEYTDGETRLNSKRLFRNRYNQLLEKAGKVDDILVIEENIRNLQEEIESQEGHLKYLDDQVTYSTLEIYLFHEKIVNKPIVVEDTFIKRFKESIHSGWNALVTFVLWFMKQWPWYILITVVVIIIKLLLKKRQKNKQKVRN